jgi:hypothetical protein
MRVTNRSLISFSTFQSTSTMTSTPNPTTTFPNRKDSQVLTTKPFGFGKVVGGTMALAVLTILGAYIFGGFEGIGTAGAAALILGVTTSYALGVGLMVAVFYSSRFYDESVQNVALDEFKDRHGDL